jgi:peptidoglycan hydrolase CwlO-like protein
MPQKTDRDIQDLRLTIDALVKAIEANTKEIAALDSKIDRLEVKLENKIDRLEAKLDSKISSLDSRLWAFGMTILAAGLAGLLIVFGRYIFTNIPIA